MKKKLRILFVFAGQILLLLFFGWLWLIFGTELVEPLADPTAISGQYAQKNLIELKNDLFMPAVVAGGVGIVCTLIWLAWSSYRKILIPTDINPMPWWILLVMGALVAGVGAFWALYLIPLLTEEARLGLILGGILIFFLVYIGGSLFTHPKMRTAVPFLHLLPVKSNHR